LRAPSSIRSGGRAQKIQSLSKTLPLCGPIRPDSGLSQQHQSRRFGPRTASAVSPAAIGVLSCLPVHHPILVTACSVRRAIAPVARR
jgi:hypothetical protein